MPGIRTLAECIGLLPSTENYARTDRRMRAGLPELNEAGNPWQIHTSFKPIVSHYAHKRSHLTLLLRSEASTIHPVRFAIEALLYPLEIHVCVYKRAVRQREYNVLNVMVGIDDGKHPVAHMPHLVAAGSIHQIELHSLPIR